MNNKVKFLRGTSDEYTVAEKDSDTIYFTTDDGKLYIGDKEISGSDVTIDDTLSDTSTNPVQGNVIKQAIDNKADKTVATTSADGLMSAEDKSKLDDADNTYALKSKYGDTTINVGRKSGTTVGKHSTAEGYSSTASGDYSHAEGASTTASGNRSHAEGYLCTASSGNSHAEGNNTTASGAHSHSEGDNTIASGVGSHSGGTSSTASGDYSFAHGMYVESNNSSEVSLGKFNKSSSDTLFSIGDGTSKTARHNAFEITKTGGKLHDKDIATTDLIPTELPANGGNADTVDGLHASAFMRYEPDISLTTSINDMITPGTYGVYSVTPDFPTGYGLWGLLEVQAYGSTCHQMIRFESGAIINRAKIVGQTEWTEWKEISTTPIKSTGWITSPTDQYGAIILPNSSTREYLSITAAGCYSKMFLDNDEYTVHITNENYEKVINTPVTYIVFYIE